MFCFGESKFVPYLQAYKRAAIIEWEAPKPMAERDHEGYVRRLVPVAGPSNTFKRGLLRGMRGRFRTW
ncbi:hypothetical protein GCM10025759_15260 [Lysobacter panacisoli]|uniref:Uncharacterized protein n=1 Tax=Lysobacter panacisoli TaxID=1255263 RepID=A0ABP9L9K5_9GAMM